MPVFSINSVRHSKRWIRTSPSPGRSPLENVFSWTSISTSYVLHRPPLYWAHTVECESGLMLCKWLYLYILIHIEMIMNVYGIGLGWDVCVGWRLLLNSLLGSLLDCAPSQPTSHPISYISTTDGQQQQQQSTNQLQRWRHAQLGKYTILKKVYVCMHAWGSKSSDKTASHIWATLRNANKLLINGSLCIHTREF